MSFLRKNAYNISDLTKGQPLTNKALLTRNSIKSILEAKETQWQTNDDESLIVSYETNSIAANSPIEDSHIEIVNGTQGFFGIFDGHSGDKTAELAASQLVPLFRSSLSRERSKQLSIIHNITKGQSAHPLQACLGDSEALCNAMAKEQSENKKNALKQLSISGVVESTLHRSFVDHDLRQIQDSLNGDGSLSLSGACAILTYIIGDHIFVANAGDCRAVLGRTQIMTDGSEKIAAIPLSNDHRLDNEDEKSRVISSHPNESDIVKDGRVKGSLMPTRGFGDFVFKLKSLKPVLKTESLWNPPYITADPEVKQHKISKGDKFLVIASDGLWEKFTNAEVVEMVDSFFRSKGTSDISNVCTFLIEQSLAKVGGNKEGCVSKMLLLDQKFRRQYHDDITITVIRFNTNNLSAHCLSKVWRQENNFPPSVTIDNKMTPPPAIIPPISCAASIQAVVSDEPDTPGRRSFIPSEVVPAAQVGVS